MPARKRTTTDRTNRKKRASPAKLKAAKKRFNAAGKKHQDATNDWVRKINAEKTARKAMAAATTTAQYQSRKKQYTAANKAQKAANKKQRTAQNRYSTANTALGKALGRESFQ